MGEVAVRAVKPSGGGDGGGSGDALGGCVCTPRRPERRRGSSAFAIWFAVLRLPSLRISSSFTERHSETAIQARVRSASSFCCASHVVRMR